MPILNVNVKNKIATAKKTTIICDNTDYTVRFTFDAEWANLTAKTMRVVFGDGSYEEVVFTGNEAVLPKAQKQRFLMVGVFSGNLHTTTPAWFPCEYSIKSSGAEHDPPSEDVYDQIIDLINTHFTTEVIANSGAGDTDPELFSLEVNGQSFVVKDTKYYQHKMLIEMSDGDTNIQAYFILSSDDHFTVEDFWDLLNRGCMWFYLGGHLYDPVSGKTEEIKSIKATKSGTVNMLNFTAQTMGRVVPLNAVQYFGDTITEL